ncbi:MAG: acyl carrier protein [Lachnospiraceae bacterium]|nr:acyl carrier protein [Lachnospiraceae bacterium]
MEEVLRVLEEVKPDVDFSVEKSLIDDAILDSFDIISIVNGLNDAFDIEITVAELLPENFNSAEAMWALVQELQEQ